MKCLNEGCPDYNSGFDSNCRSRVSEELYTCPNPPMKVEAACCSILSTKWALGAMPKGHDHYNYAVITELGEVIVKCGIDKKLADYIVELHNDKLSTQQKTI